MADLFADEELERAQPARRRGERAARRPPAAAEPRRSRRAGASDRARRRDRADGRGRQAVVDDPVGAARHRQDEHRAAARRCGRPALRRRSPRSFRASPTSRSSSPKPQTAARAGQRTLLFVDEIHRFNRAQQDGFLPYVEDGTVTLVGATTENPSFELNAALAVALPGADPAPARRAGAGNADRARRGRGRPPAPADRRRPRGADRQRRRRRPLPPQPGRDPVRRRARRAARSGRPGGAAAPPRRRSTTRTARAITTSSRRFTKACAARTRRPRFIISRGCSSPARSRSTSSAG